MSAMTSPLPNFITVEYLFYSRVQPADENPFIGRFSFLDQTCMTNWIDLLGSSWDVVTLSEAVELAEDMTGVACEYKPCIQAEVVSVELLRDIDLVVDPINTATAFIKLVLCVDDIFSFTVMSENDIRDRLGCIKMQLETSSHRDVWCLPLDTSQKLGRLLDNLIKWEPSKFKGITTLSRQLTIIRALHLVDRVYHVMFEYHFSRIDHAYRRHGEAREWSYKLQRSA